MTRKFKGGKKKYRDKWYGYNDRDFQNWWHREGKQDKHDLQSAVEVKKVYDYWVGIGCPKVK